MVSKTPFKLYQVSWSDLETHYLTCFYKKDIEVTMFILIALKQKQGISIKDFIDRFCNLSQML